MRFLVIQHLDIEPPALIGESLLGAGHRLEYAHVDQGDVLPEDMRDLAGAIIMGGPQSANDTHLDYIRAELDWLKRQLDEGLPMLGICLGAQMMAKAAGAVIRPSPIRELGWYPVLASGHARSDPLFRDLPGQGLEVFQWHGETFALPKQAQLVATHFEVPHQAFRLNRAQYGIQFHVEVDESIIGQWIHAGSSERAYLGEAGLMQLRVGTSKHLDEMRSFCRKLMKNWLALLG